MFQLGPYDLQGPIARGGLGEVWRGHHRAAGVPVAVKLLSVEVVGPRAAALDAEIRAIAGLDHPHVVWLYDHGVTTDDHARSTAGRIPPSTPWLAMELAEGGTLHDRQRHLDWWQLVAVLGPLLDALAHAHARGVLHRDLKPGNVLFGGARPGPKLSDFGLTRTRDGPRMGGTPGYSAPEQVGGRWVDEGPWTDLFSLGVVAWAAITGAKPFHDAPGPRLPAFRPRFAVPEGTREWLGHLLAPRTRDRFQHAADAARCLEGLGHPLFGGATAVTLPPGLPHHWRSDEVRVPPLPDAGLGLVALRTHAVVGREAERQTLWRALAGVVTTGAPRLVLVQGPSGVGKTRLATWLAHRGQESGAVQSLRITHSPDGSATDGVAGLAARWLKTSGSSRSAVRERARRQLAARGVTDPQEAEALIELAWPASLADRMAGAPRVRFAGDSERHAVARRLLSLLAVERPVVLLVEDAQWGRDTLDFVASLLDGAPPTAPVLVLLTARDDLLAEREHEDEALSVLGRHPAARELVLGPLEVAAIEELLHQHLDIEPELARRVAERSGGNPLFAVQLAQEWATGGAGPQAEPAFPASLERLWGPRLDRLLAEEPRWGPPLELAACLGPIVSGHEWVAACAAARVEAPRALVIRLLGERLATVDEEGRGLQWSFVHGMLRETLLARAGRAGRAGALNAACAAALADAEDVDTRTRRARHLEGAGRAAAAIDAWGEVAADLAEAGDTHRSLEVLDHREAALARLGVPDTDPRRGVGLVRRLVQAFRLGRVELDDDIAALEARAEGPGWEPVQIELWTFLANLHLARGDARTALVYATRARDAARALKIRRLEAEAWFQLGRAAIQNGDAGLSIDALERAADLRDTPYGEAEAYLEMATPHLLVRQDLAAARVCLDEGCRRAREAGSRYQTARGTFFMGALHTYAGRLDEAVAAYAEAREHFMAVGARTGAVSCRIAMAAVRIRQQRFHEARQDVETLLAQEPLHTYQRRGAHLALLACVAPEPDDLRWREHLDGLGTVEWAEIANVELLELAGHRALTAGYPERARDAWVHAIPLWEAHDPRRAARLRELCSRASQTP